MDENHPLVTNGHSSGTHIGRRGYRGRRGFSNFQIWAPSLPVAAALTAPKAEPTFNSVEDLIKKFSLALAIYPVQPTYASSLQCGNSYGDEFGILDSGYQEFVRFRRKFHRDLAFKISGSL